MAGAALAQGSTRQEHGFESHSEHVRLDTQPTLRGVLSSTCLAVGRPV